MAGYGRYTYSTVGVTTSTSPTTIGTINFNTLINGFNTAQQFNISLDIELYTFRQVPASAHESAYSRWLVALSNDVLVGGGPLLRVEPANLTDTLLLATEAVNGVFNAVKAVGEVALLSGGGLNLNNIAGGAAYQLNIEPQAGITDSLFHRVFATINYTQP